MLGRKSWYDHIRFRFDRMVSCIGTQYRQERRSVRESAGIKKYSEFRMMLRGFRYNFLARRKARKCRCMDIEEFSRFKIKLLPFFREIVNQIWL